MTKDMFELLSKSLGVPLAKLLLKSFLGEPASVIGGGLLEIAAKKIADGFARRQAERQFTDLADRICQQLVPLFEQESRRIDLTPEAVVHQLVLTLEGQVSAAAFIERNLDPAALEQVFRTTRPVPPGQYSDAETRLYDRALTEIVRYLVGVVNELPKFEAQFSREVLQRLAQQTGSIETMLAAIGRIEQRLAPEAAASVGARFEADYRQAIVRSLDYVELFGADISLEAQRHALSVAYISINVQRGIDTLAEPAESVLNGLTPGADRLLIRGNAGSGKSTLFRWIALEAAKGADPEATRTKAAFVRPGRHGVADASGSAVAEVPDWRRRVPFLIRLRDCPEGRLPPPEEFPGLVREASGAVPEGWVGTVLQGGSGLVLFDGVDEVPNQARGRIEAAITAFVRRFPRAMCLVSTRPEGVPGGWLAAAGFAEAQIEPMSTLDRDRFIEKWHEAVGQRLRDMLRPDPNLPRLAAALKEALRGNPGIARLATNPLLCAMICALHRDRRQHLPDSQAELCEDLCRMLLHRREEEGGLSLQAFPQAYRDLRYEQKRLLVQDLACDMVEGEQHTLPVDQVERRIARTLADLPGRSAADAPVLRRTLVERSGMLRERRPGWIDFIHNTFKEYLAAERFVRGDHFGLLCRNALKADWRPVVLFAAASRQPGFATEMVSRLLHAADQAGTRDRARDYRLLALNCRSVALLLDRQRSDQLDAIQRTLFPPRTIAEAEALALSGDAAVPFLRHRSTLNARQAAACVRALRLIGTEPAQAALDGYLADGRQAVIAELVTAVNPLRLPAIRKMLERGEPLPDGVRKQVSDLGPLAGLTGLQSLHLAGTAVSDLGPLAGLTSLQELDLRGTRVTDLGSVQRLPSLSHVILTKGHDCPFYSPGFI